MSKTDGPSVPFLKMEGAVNISDFIREYLTGPNKDKFNSLFENKFITPLLNEIQKQISTAPIKLTDINLDKILNDFTTIDPAVIAEFKSDNKKAYTEVNSKIIEKINSLAAHIVSVDAKSMTASFMSSITQGMASFDKGSIKMPEIKLPAINISKIEPEIAKRYNNLAKDIINKLADNISTLKIDTDTNISYNSILDVIFRNTPEYSNNTNRLYQSLVQRALFNIGDSISKLSNIESEEKYTQRDLFKFLFNQSVEMNLSASTAFNEMRSTAISFIKENVGHLAAASLNDSYTQKDLFNILFSRTPEMSREANGDFNKLRIAAIDILKPTIDKLSSLNNTEKYTQKDLFNALFNQTPEMGMYAARSFNLLRMDGITILGRSLENLKNLDTEKKFTQKDLFSTLFNQTPEMGLFSTLAFNSLRINGIQYLQNAVESLKDVDINKKATQKDLLNVLFNKTPEMGLFSTLRFNSLRISAMDILEKSLKNLELKLNDDTSLSQKNILDLLFNKTPEMGFFTKLQYGDLVQTAIKKLKMSVNAIPDFQSEYTSKPSTDIRNKFIDLSKETLDIIEIRVRTATIDAINKTELLTDIEDTWIVENLKSIREAINNGNITQKDNYKLLLSAIENSKGSRIIPTAIASGGGAAAGAAVAAETGTVAALVTGITGGVGAFITGTVLPALAVAAGGLVGWKIGEYALNQKIESKSRDNMINYSPKEIRSSQESSQSYYETNPEEAEKIFQQTGKYPFNRRPSITSAQPSMATETIGSSRINTDFTPLTNYLGTSFNHLDGSLRDIASILTKIANKSNSESNQTSMINIGGESSPYTPGPSISKSIHDFRSTVTNSRPKIGAITNVVG